MRLPDFLVIGAPRSGTTTLHYCLGQHPEVLMSPTKETNFFLFDGATGPASGIAAQDFEAMQRRSATTLGEYVSLFAEATTKHRAVGESSPAYLLCPEVAARIKGRLPKVKLIAILRQPVEQALSVHRVQHGIDTAGSGLIDRFFDALQSETLVPEDRRDGLALAEYGLYHRHLLAYFEQFDRSRIKVVLYEDLVRCPDTFFPDLFRFLEVDPGYHPDLSARYNQTGVPRSALVQRALDGSQRLKRLARKVLPHDTSYWLARLHHQLRTANLGPAKGLSPELKRELTQRYYLPDIAALEGLIGRDLSVWRH